MRHVALVLVALFMSCAGCAYAADPVTDLPGEPENVEQPPMEWFYDEWDTNDDGRVDEEEFYAGYKDSGLFDDWDANEDGVVVEDELGEGLYDYWDADDDGFIEEDEVEDRGFWDW